jgi:hypothetical protein
MPRKRQGIQSIVPNCDDQTIYLMVRETDIESGVVTVVLSRQAATGRHLQFKLGRRDPVGVETGQYPTAVA